MKYFGTDGIRGIPNKKLNLSLLTNLGRALKKFNNNTIAIATDTRISKDMIKYAIASGVLSVGINVIFLGVLPTPALIYYSFKNNCIGVMITASHNPYTDNGIKIVNNGFKITNKEELLLEELIDNEAKYYGDLGIVSYNTDFKEYFDFILNKTIKSKLKIILDCANGAVYKTAPYIFNKITNDLVVIATNPNGYNINKNVGSTNIDNLKNHLINQKCDIGFSFDGDGDRVICVDKLGNIIDGDLLTYIIACYLKDINKLNKNTVVLSVMSNLGIISKLKEKDINVIEVPVGDKHIINAINEYGLSLGGESSGHIIYYDEFHTGDGVFIATQIIKIIEYYKTNITNLISDVELYCSKLVNIKACRSILVNNDVLDNKIKEIKMKLNYDCKIIVRPSGTEDLIRVFVMAKNKIDVDKYSKEIVAILTC